MSTPCETGRATAATLTRTALRLLDISFEPASVCCGERFDHVVEALSDHLSDSATALMARTPQPVFAAPRVPPVPSAVSRRAQSALREAVEAGTLPGSSRSARACAAALREAVHDLRGIAVSDGTDMSTSLTPCVRALERLTWTIETYAQSRARITAALSMPGCVTTNAADVATRSERALLRCLERTGDTRPLH